MLPTIRRPLGPRSSAATNTIPSIAIFVVKAIIFTNGKINKFLALLLIVRNHQLSKSHCSLGLVFAGSMEFGLTRLMFTVRVVGCSKRW